MSGRLAGKVAVVTGAGSRGAGIGNGKAAAILFAREGAAVVCADQIVARADDTVAAIVAEGGTASSLACDVSHREGCQQLAAAAVERYGRLDILQNNVGIPSDQSLEDITEEAWDHVMGVNVRSMVLAAQAVGRICWPAGPAPSSTSHRSPGCAHFRRARQRTRPAKLRSLA